MSQCWKKSTGLADGNNMMVAMVAMILVLILLSAASASSFKKTYLPSADTQVRKSTPKLVLTRRRGIAIWILSVLCSPFLLVLLAKPQLAIMASQVCLVRLLFYRILLLRFLLLTPSLIGCLVAFVGTAPAGRVVVVVVGVGVGGAMSVAVAAAAIAVAAVAVAVAVSVAVEQEEWELELEEQE